MSAIPLHYSFRHIIRRRATALFAIGGFALVVSIFAATLMLAQGVRQALSYGGSADRFIAIRSGAQNEIQSSISRDGARVIETLGEVRQDQQNRLHSRREAILLLSLARLSDELQSNVVVRGTSANSGLRRPCDNIIFGRNFTPGTYELVIGKAINARFANASIGSFLRIGGVDWKIVGIFDGNNSSFDSEIVGDVESLLPLFKREAFSSLTFETQNPEQFESIKKVIENDARLSITLKREDEFLREQSETFASFIEILGLFVTAVFTVAAIICALITMHAAVAQRARELALLRAIGFSRLTILWVILREAWALALTGAIVGLGLAALLSIGSVSATNFGTFSDLTFAFALNFKICTYAIMFALIVGSLAALIPASRAALMPVVQALRRG